MPVTSFTQHALCASQARKEWVRWPAGHRTDGKGSVGSEGVDNVTEALFAAGAGPTPAEEAGLISQRKSW